MKILFKTCMAALCSIMLLNVQAQNESPLLTNMTNREAMTLDGKWRYIVDPMENGYYNYRYKVNPNGYFKDQKPETVSDLIEYDFDKSGQLNVPGDWNTQREDLFFYEGTVWYKKSFIYEPSDQRAFLYFGAVNYDAKVYLNGEKIGEHIGGFTPFNFEVTNLLKAGENFVVVKVDNTRKSESIPTKNSDWYNFGGITRSVKLVEVPKTFIRDYAIQLKKGSKTDVEGWVQLDGAQLTQKVQLEIPEARVKLTLTPDATGLAKVSFKTKLSLWSDKNPKLYEVSLTSGDDQVKDQIGFRSIETRGNDILLNGEPVFLKGISIHEVAAFTGGRVIAPEQCLTLLNWARDLGCNFVRLAHYPHNEDMVRLADQMGIMVWSEIPVYWTIDWENQSVFDNAQNQLREMITRDKNRAAVIMWSVANETPISDPRTDFLKRLVVSARDYDNTRLLTGALEPHSEDGYRVIDDALGESLDVIGINNYCGWYGGTPVSCAGVEWKMIYDKPLVISEFGGGALQGLHGLPEERWTEEYQEDVYKYNIEMLKNIPFLRGTTPWILMDFYSARRPLPDIQDFFNRKGLISDQGVKKKAFFVLKKYYSEKPIQLD
ncbi:glycoside hydrolase family 2 protein [Marinoscillum luteum]|uniref:Glycoside hydrolase family 2 protein n=1 Tax=Marinoscillum luteum TaxID=861051 RepID=A0ABW7ND30_9BACT